MLPFPMSPAPSDCDSLASDEIDAILEAQGELSHWPTPPPPRDETQSATSFLSDESFNDEEDELDYYHMATVFTQEASIEIDASPSDIELVHRILVRAQLPPDVLAVSFNILSGLHCRSLPQGSFYSAPSDLLLASVLSLTVSYMSDHPPSLKYWAREVCDGTWTAARINATVLQILAALDWRLLEFGSALAVQQALARLTKPILFDRMLPTPPAEENWDFLSEPRETAFEQTTDLKVAIEGTPTWWVNGQLTPEATPTETSFGCAGNPFLPLL